MRILFVAFFFFAFSLIGAEKLFEYKLTTGDMEPYNVQKRLLNKIIVEKDGQPAIYLSGKEEMWLKLPFEKWPGRKVYVTCNFKIKDVPKPAESWQGFKYYSFYQSEGKGFGGQTTTPWGTADWQDSGYWLEIGKTPTNGNIVLAIPGGEAWIRSIIVWDGLDPIKKLDFDQAAIKKEWKPFNCSEPLENDKSNEVVTTYYGGLVLDGMDWEAEKIKQLEVTFSAAGRKGGYLELKFYGVENDKKVSSTQCSSVIPDGKLHTLIFPVGENPQWRGHINTIYLTWCAGSTRIGLASVRALTQDNLLPAAEKIEVGKSFPVNYLRPRGTYELTWSGGENPGMTLICLDRDYNSLKSVELPAGKNAVTFESPEMTISGVLSLSGSAKGYPRLQLRNMPKLNEPPTTWKGSWIWSQREEGPEWTYIWFQREFELPGEVEDATFAGVADDSYEAYINDRLIGTGNYWPVPNRFGSVKGLKPGKNVLTIRTFNGTQNGGLLCDLYVRSGGKDIFITTDEKWTMKVGPKERPSAITDPVLVIGSASIAPWASSLGYHYAGPKGEIKILEAHNGGFTAEVLNPTISDIKQIGLNLVPESGKPEVRKVAITPSTGTWKVGDKVKVTYLPLKNNAGGKVYIEDNYLRTTDNAVIAELQKVIKPAPALVKTSLKNVGRRPMIVIDGKEYSPIFWQLAGGFDNQPTDKSFLVNDAREAGISLMNFSVYMDKFWTSKGEFDFSHFDLCLKTIMETNPDARLMLQIYCFMPEWWLKENPDDVTRYYDNKPLRSEMDKQALASKKWLADCRIGLKALIDHIKKSEYADRFFAASMSESINSEWFWNITDKEGKPAVGGYSKADYATFRSYLRERYKTDAGLSGAWKQPGVTFDNFTMPTPDEQQKGSIGALLDPQQDRKLMDWFDFRNRSIAEAVIELCKIVKEETGGKWLTGAYYGYFVEFCISWYRPIHDHGHNGFLEVAASPYVDFLRAPSKYNSRMIGMSDYIMMPQDTFSYRGKLVYVEQDFRSFTEIRDDNNVYGRHNTATESVGALNRAFGMMLAQGVTQYWLDFGRWLEEKCLLSVIDEQNRVLATLPPVSGTTPHELCIVGDRDSVYYTKRISFSKDDIFSGANSDIIDSFNETAIPYRQLTVTDLLEKGLVPAHKFYIVTTALMLSKEQRTALLERFEREKSTVLWIYAPGAFYPDNGPSGDNVGDFLGLKCEMLNKTMCPSMKLVSGWGAAECTNPNTTAPWFFPVKGFDEVIGRGADGKPMLVTWKRNGATHYFSTLLSLPNELLRSMASKAGVHVYNAESSDPLWIGNDVVFLHAKGSGEKAIILPEGTRMRAIIGPVKGIFESGQRWKAEAGQTYGFLVERKK
ncbi:MAG: beta-galactosidase [Lentisphaerae bacterium]|nr:beta-galactosidase [Lentisphaerota bacterium]